MPDVWTVECVCTDRGQHKRTWMARMIWEAPWQPTAEQRASYRAAISQPVPDGLPQPSAEEVEERVKRQGHGGWRAFDPERAGLAPKHAMFGHPNPSAEPGTVFSQESYGFACSRCSRWPKRGRDKWIALMNAARDAGVSEFDVSYLD